MASTSVQDVSDEGAFLVACLKYATV